MTANLIEILISAKDLADPVLDRTAAKSKGLGGVISEMGKVSVVALAGIGVEAVHMATEYESATTRLVTSAGEQQSNLDLVRKGMLDMAGQVGVSAQDLAKAMYYVESAGFHGADGLTVLKAAAQGAAAEGADTTTVVKAMTDVLVDYHEPASDAAKVTSQMITAVSFGKTSLQDFSGAFASIVPAASAAGISFNDVAGALAEMTNHGFTANRASQNLAQALRSLLNPTNVMQGAFDEYGVSSQVLREKLSGPNGLTDAMEYLSQKAEKAGKEGTPAFAAALKALMGTAPGANAALATVGENFDATSAAIKGIGGATTDAQGNVKGFTEINQTLGQKVKELQASFDSLMIELGNKLIPVVKDATDWMLNHQGTVIDVGIALAALMGTVIAISAAMKVAAGIQAVWSVGTKVAAGVMWLFNDACIGTRIGLMALAVAQKAAAAAQWLFNAALDANPIGIVIVALAALGAAMYLLVTHWKEVTAFVKQYSLEIEAALVMLLGPFGVLLAAVLFLSMHWKQIMNDLRQWLWDDFGAPVGRFFTDTIPRWFDTAVRDVRGAWNAVYDAIFAPVKHAYDDVVHFLDSLLQTIESLPGKAADAAGKAASSLVHAGGGWNPLNWFHAAGGIVGAAVGGARGGWAMVGEQGPEMVQLPYGSSVMPNSNTMSALSSMLGGGFGGGGALQIELVSNGAEDLFLRFLRHAIRVRGGNVQTVLGVNR